MLRRLPSDLVTALAILAPLFLTACATAPPQARPAIRVASDLDNRPFAYVDETGTPSGRDVEMMHALAEHAGLDVVWRRMPFEDLLPAAERGDVEAVCATLGITAERSQRVLFTKPYFVTSIAVIVRDGDAEPRSHADLAGKRVAAGIGTTSELAVRRFLPGATLAGESKEGATTRARLLAREVDAAVLDGPAAEALVADSDGMLRLLEPLTVERYAIALPMQQVALKAKLDAALVELAADWDALDRRHGLVSATREP